MNKDHSFEKIDLTKLLLWLCLLLLFVFIVWAALIMPSSNLLKISQDELITVKSALLKEQNSKINLEGQIKELEATHSRELGALRNEFNKDKFLAFAKAFFEEARLEDDLLPDSSDYAGYRLLVSTKINSPISFYDFLDSLSSYENILKVDFPIVMKSHEQIIKAQFNVKVYKAKN